MPPDLFVALTHRNFRLIWLGLLASITGSMMQNAGAAVARLAARHAGDGRRSRSGMVGLVRVVPIVVFSMLSGVVADAWNRRTLMLLTQTGAALVSLVLAVLTFRGLTLVWPIYVLAALGAAVGAFDLPARQALVPTLVPRERPAERHQPEHDHVPGGVGGRARRSAASSSPRRASAGCTSSTRCRSAA